PSDVEVLKEPLMIAKTDRRCMIIAPSGTELDALTRALRDHGFIPVAPTESATGSHWLDFLTEQFKSIELVVGVFAPPPENTEVALEIGLAFGLGKPLLIVAPPDATLPFGLLPLRVIRATPDNRAALDLACSRNRIAQASRLRRRCRALI